MVISVAVAKQQNAKVLNAFVLSEELSVDLNVMVLLRQTVLTNDMNKVSSKYMYNIVFRNFPQWKVECIHMDCMSPYYCKSTYTTCIQIYLKNVHNGKLRVYIWTACHPTTASRPILHA